MIWIALVLSLVFAAVGFTVTENNAKYLLSGYNTMSEHARAQFDISAYLTLFRRFHLVLAVALLVGVALLSLFNNNWASIFMTTFPLLAYLYFLVRSAGYHGNNPGQKLGVYIAGGVLVLVLGFLLFSSVTDYRSSELKLDASNLIIEGSFGVTLKKQDVQAQALVDQLPEISYKSNGFAAGDYAKGRFKLEDGRTVWLFVNKKADQFLYIRTLKGEIYYSHDQNDMQNLNREITQWRAAMP